MNLPYTKIWISRVDDTLRCAYINVYGTKINEEIYPDYLPDTLYLGVSVSGFNDLQNAEFIVSDLTINSEKVEILGLNDFEVNTISNGYDYNYSELHSNFSITDGESLYLFDNNSYIDSVLILDNSADISQIFINEQWMISNTPTPANDWQFIIR